jgi:hypothetical protein
MKIDNDFWQNPTRLVVPLRRQIRRLRQRIHDTQTTADML